MMLLFWIVVGAFVGWLTGKFMSSEGRDQLMDVVMGIAGAVGGAFLLSAAHILVQGRMIYTMLAAMAGAVIPTVLTRHLGGRLEYGSTD
ncbi:MAG: GlsB/YeaQ/YmgE family stress response membrane protein [Candidatus Acidiferrales bacterium]